ncbi:hypothetical protein TVAG_306270 [Trichomonas vaginalis G3]|uniref:PAS domain-containing protein n=1 Tax=Trichomonas vaginalis (strain ATCC PRA-98 / G3) TaxID=412133 RepID=A2DNB8_TRIV3|nr:guanylate cyclase protein [Trichomonas vaginalis G3]EAY18106.1 hypothetical protein TVAG_306270 [Trichomonas vaginalis G3]KAI5492383.1 guanylate cyclase protein [Trichomonas vaginalis G3]|eukprot:XP_001579092.1 hypothetical protein [Trichomonas vaginalis G3]
MTAHQQCSTGLYGRDGLIDTINSIRADSPCNFSLSESTYHESLACLSLDSGVSAFYNLMTGLIIQASSTTFFTDSDFIQTFHYINSHLYYQMEERVDDLLEQGKKEGDVSDTFVSALAVICIFITLVEFLISAYRNVFLFRTYRTLINFILRANPTDAVANDDLMMILLNRKISQRMAKMSETATLLANTSHPLIFTTHDGVIVYVNSSFQIVFNYEVSHIVGQNISLITDIDKLEKIYHQDKTIKETVVKDDATEDEGFNKHETVVFDHKNLRMKRENGQEIECDVLPIMTGTRSNKLFAFVVTDLSSVTAKQKKINILKGANDTLQTNMMPKVLSENEGKTKVGNATVCTIRLVQFSNSLAPAAVMKQKKSILVKLDECLKKYDVLEILFFAQGMYSIISRDPNATTHVFRFIDDVLASFDDPTFFGEITIGVDTNGEIDLKITDKEIKEIVSLVRKSLCYRGCLQPSR